VEGPFGKNEFGGRNPNRFGKSNAAFKQNNHLVKAMLLLNMLKSMFKSNASFKLIGIHA
jgi:hypothetical protein